MVFIGRVRELARWIGTDDPEVQRLLSRAERHPEIMETVERILQKKALEKQVDPANPPVFDVPQELPREGRLLGNVQRGNVPGDNYLYPAPALSSHMGIFGLTGAGKSMLAGHLAVGWIEQGITVIFFDTADEYLFLTNHFGPDQLGVINARRFPLAPFLNPVASCFSDLAWASGTVSVFRQSMFFRDGSCNLLFKVVGDIYQQNEESQSASLDRVFTDLISRKFSVQSRHAGYLETLVNRFQGMIQSFPWFNARSSLVPSQVLERSLIIRMGDLSPEESEIFVNLFLHWLNSERMRELRPEIDVVLVFEEAHRMMSQQRMRRYDLGEPLILEELRTGRKYGTGVVVIDQVPSELPYAVLGNVGTRIAFRLANAPCIHTIANSMGLDRDQADELAELPARRAVVQTPDNPVPFLLQVIELTERQLPTAEEIERRERMTLESLDYELGEVDAAQILFTGGKQRREEQRNGDALSGDMHMIMGQICRKPFETVEERNEALDMDRAQEYRGRRNLEKLGMIVEAGKVGGKRKIYVPTGKGTDWAHKNDLPVYRYKGSIIHEVMVRQVSEALERFSESLEVVSEGEALGDSGLQPDLVVGVRDRQGDHSRRVAVQISYRNKPDYEVERALELREIAQIDEVVVVARDKRSCKSLKRRFEGSAEGEGMAKSDQEEIAPGLRVLDFETCVSKDYDWSWMFGNG